MTSHADVARLVGEDRAFQEAYWSAQRLCWGLMGGLLLAALLGLLGAEGPFAHRHVRAGSAQLDHPRTMRWNAPDQLMIRARPAADGWINLQLPADFADRFELEGSTPEAAASLAGPAGAILRFRAATPQPGLIILRLRPRVPLALYRAQVRTSTGSALPLTVLILP
ncbi:MAG: hypothetical protein ACKOXK_05300 [Chakrabartia sp.]